MTHEASATRQTPSSCNIHAPMREVGGKVAFITGGDSGIGLGIARAFVSAGMKVVITYQTQAHLDRAMEALKDAGDCVRALRVDVTDRSSLAAAANETVRVFGRVHVLVNNAGVGLITPITCATFDDWDWCMNVNVNGVFNGIRIFLPYIRAHQEGGQIVATSSLIGGLIVGPFWGVYSTSKFAIVGMMEALRSELSNTNIGVSVFCPAGVSSNIGDVDRNRPPYLLGKGKPDTVLSPRIDAFSAAMRDALKRNPNSDVVMDPLEAGERVLRGIRNNDLYIISHAEYDRAIRDRSDAVLASLLSERKPVSSARAAVAEIARNPIYIDEVKRKRHQDAKGWFEQSVES